MGKNYESPIHEEISSSPPVVSETKKTNLHGKQDTAVTANGKPTVKTSVTLIDVYKRQLDEFNMFVLNKHRASGPAQRKEAMIGFARLLNSIFKSEQKIADKALRYFIGNINLNIEKYRSGEMFAPIFTMKKKEIPHDVNFERFMNTVFFLIGLAENIQSVNRYIGGRDLGYFFREWSVPQRQVMINFIESIRS